MFVHVYSRKKYSQLYKQYKTVYNHNLQWLNVTLYKHVEIHIEVKRKVGVPLFGPC